MLDKITAAKTELDGFVGQIKLFTDTLQGDDGGGAIKDSLARLEIEFDEQCWIVKAKGRSRDCRGHSPVFCGKKRDFKDRILREAKTNAAALKPLQKIWKTRAESLFGTTPEKGNTDSCSLEFAKLLACESNPILGEKIIGKMDVDIAAMIQKLGNSDWVREGKSIPMRSMIPIAHFVSRQRRNRFPKV